MSGALAGGVDRFLASLRNERQLSAHTGAGYARDLAALVEFCETQGIAGWRSLDAQHVREFAARCHRRGLSPASIQRRLSAVRSFCRFLLREGELKHNPAAGVQAPKARKRLPVTLDADTMGRLLEFRSDERLGIRDKAIMELFYSSGLRLSELLGLDLGDIDLRDRTVRVTGKGRKTRIVPVGRHAVGRHQALARRARRRRGGRRARRVYGPGRPPPRAAHRAATHRPLGAAHGPARARAPAHVPALVRLAPARVERRPARGAGTAGSRQHQHDAGVHAPRLPASRAGLRHRASAGAAQDPRRGRVLQANRSRHDGGHWFRTAWHDDPLRAPQRRRGHGRRRPGHSRQHGNEGQCAQGAPAARGQGDRGLCGRHRGRVHAVRALRGQAHAVRQPHARGDRARQGLAVGPEPAASRGAAVRGRPDAFVPRLRQRRRDRARARAGRGGLRRRVRPGRGARAAREHRSRRTDDRREGARHRGRHLHLHQPQPDDRDAGP